MLWDKLKSVLKGGASNSPPEEATGDTIQPEKAPTTRLNPAMLFGRQPTGLDPEALLRLGQLTSRFAAHRQLAPLLEEAAGQVRRHFDLYGVELYLVEVGRRWLQLRAMDAEQEPAEPIESIQLRIDNQTACGLAALERRAVELPQVAASPLFDPRPHLSETVSALALPLDTGSELLGVLYLLSRDPGYPLGPLRPACELVAVHLGLAMANALLFEQQVQIENELREQSRRGRQQDWERYLDRMEIAEPLVVRRGAASPVVSPSDPDTVAIPIEIDGVAIGRLSLKADNDRPLDEQDLDFARAVAEQIAQRVDNLRLLNEAETYRQEAEETLRRMTQQAWASHENLVDAGEPVVFSSRGHSSETGGDAMTEGAEQIIFPLVVQGQPIGELHLLPRQEESAPEVVEAILDTLSDHIENLRLTAETERRATELAIINRVNDTIRGRLELDEVFHAVGEELRRAFQTTTAYIATYDETSRTVLFPYYVTSDDGAAGVQRSVNPLPLGQGITSRIITSRRPFLLNADARQEILDAGAVEIDTGPLDARFSYLGVPILVAGEALGVISIQDSTGKRRFTERDQALLSTISTGLGITIQNARLFKQTEEALASARRQSRELEAINRVVLAAGASQNLDESLQTVADELLNVTAADQVGVALMNPDRRSLRIVAASGGGRSAEAVIGQTIPIVGNPSTELVLATRQTQIFEDAQQHPMLATIHDIMKARQVHTLAILPIITPAGVIGTIGLDITNAEETLSPEQIQLAETVVLQASAIIESNRLFSETQKRAERERRMRNITDRIRSGGSREEILAIAREEIAALIGASRSTVWLGSPGMLQERLKAVLPAEGSAGGRSLQEKADHE